MESKFWATGQMPHFKRLSMSHSQFSPQLISGAYFKLLRPSIWGSPKYFSIMNQVTSHLWWTTPKGHNKTCMFTYRYRWWSGMRHMWASPSVRSWGIFLDCCHSPPSALCPTELQRKQQTINMQHLHRETKCATISGKFRRGTTLEAFLFA